VTFTELAAALVERLYFYGSVLDKMESAVRGGDTDRIEAYSKLESLTASEILCLRRCFAARENEAPRDYGFGRRAEGIMQDIRAASRRLAGLLENEKQAVLARLQELRAKNPPAPFRTETPSLIDYQA
jgi:hypothetical protein